MAGLKNLRGSLMKEEKKEKKKDRMNISETYTHLFGCDDVCTLNFDTKRLRKPSSRRRIIFSTMLTNIDEKKTVSFNITDHRG